MWKNGVSAEDLLFWTAEREKRDINVLNNSWDERLCQQRNLIMFFYDD